MSKEPVVAYDWRADLKPDKLPDEEEAAGIDPAAIREEPKQAAKEAPPPKRKKPKFL